MVLYDATPQIAYMYSQSFVDTAISSDSSLLFYGVPLLTNFDSRQMSGNFYMHGWPQFFARQNYDININNFFIQKLLRDGCDYFPSNSGAKMRQGKIFFPKGP